MCTLEDNPNTPTKSLLIPESQEAPHKETRRSSSPSPLDDLESPPSACQISKLNNDELREIFFQCLSHEGIGPGCLSFPTITLSHVCRRWRSVALLSGRLWARISLSRLEIAQLYLRRCKDVPLQLTWSKYATGQRELEKTALEELRTRVGRVHKIDEFRVGPIALATFFATAGALFPVLKICHIDPPTFFSSYRFYGPVSFRLQAPQLRELKLACLVLKTADLLATLRESPLLESLNLKIPLIDEHPQSCLPPARLPLLRKLTLERLGNRRSSYAQFTHALRIPSTVTTVLIEPATQVLNRIEPQVYVFR